MGIANTIDNIDNIQHFLENSARRFPGKVAVIQGETEKSYSELNWDADRVAAWLTSIKVLHGDRVLLISENSPEYISGYYGILKTGAVVVPINTDITSETLRVILDDIQPTAIIVSSRFEKRFQSDLSECTSLKGILLKSPKMRWSAKAIKVTTWEDIVCHDWPEPFHVQIQATDLASIIFTSGSTGRPKGVMLSHRNIISNTSSIIQYLQLTPDDIQMVVLPFHYVMGKSLLNTHMAVGARIIINNRFIFTAAVLEEMAEQNVTGFSGVPSTYAYLIHRSPLGSFQNKLPSLRYCSQAGGHLPNRLKREVIALLPAHTCFIVMYGATEASARLSYLDPRYLWDKPNSIGKPIPGVSMMILGSDGKPRDHHQTGEIVGFGPNIMMGYWKNPQATRDAFWQGGYRTGDIGYRDSEGFYFITGRKDDLVKVSGHRVSLREIEDEMIETGMLLEAAVFAVDDPLSGKRLCALAVPHNRDLAEVNLQKELARRLPKFKRPADLQLLNSLPKFSSGKVNRSACQRMLADIPDRCQVVQ